MVVVGDEARLTVIALKDSGNSVIAETEKAFGYSATCLSNALFRSIHNLEQMLALR